MTTPLFSAACRFVFGKGATHREIDAERREKIRRDAHDLCLLGGPVSPTTSLPSRKMERLEKAAMLPRRS